MRDHEFAFVARTAQGAYVSGVGLGQYFSTYDIDGALRLSDAGFNSIAKQIAVDRVSFYATRQAQMPAGHWREP